MGHLKVSTKLSFWIYLWFLQQSDGKCPEYTCKYSTAATIMGVSGPSVIWRNNCLIASLTDYLQMCSIRAKEKATWSHDQGLHYHISKSFLNSPEETCKSEAFPQISHPSGTERRMGLGQRMREKKRASQILLQGPEPGFWSGQPQPGTLSAREVTQSPGLEKEKEGQLTSQILRPGLRQ